jgi:hypothetical protein
MEEEWLAYILCKQHFHAHKVHANATPANNEGEENEEEFHPKIKLPASFVGSQAWTSEQTADAMALGHKFGKPTFFCTMTFNPDWPEVWEYLEPGQPASDVPVIVV